MTIIVVFALFLSAALILVILKAVELRRKRKNAVLRLLCRLDPKLNRLVFVLKFTGLQLVQSIRYIFLVRLKITCRDLFNGIREKIGREYKIRQNAIMGRKETVSKNCVSFYLKKITENKENKRRGMIE